MDEGVLLPGCSVKVIVNDLEQTTPKDVQKRTEEVVTAILQSS